jgi:hypothetical protein
MWDATNLNLLLSSESPGLEQWSPHLAKNERDMGHPAFSSDKNFKGQISLAANPQCPGNF